MARSRARLGRTNRPSSRNAVRSRRAAEKSRPFAFELGLRRRRADCRLKLTRRAVRSLSAWLGATELQTPRQTFCLWIQQNWSAYDLHPRFLRVETILRSERKTRNFLGIHSAFDWRARR